MLEARTVQSRNKLSHEYQHYPAVALDVIAKKLRAK